MSNLQAKIPEHTRPEQTQNQKRHMQKSMGKRKEKPIHMPTWKMQQNLSQSKPTRRTQKTT